MLLRGHRKPTVAWRFLVRRCGCAPRRIRCAPRNSRRPRLDSLRFCLRQRHNSTLLKCVHLPFSTRKKNREPLGKRTRCEVLSSTFVVTTSPSLYQVIFGSGTPLALHCRVTGSVFGTMVSSGCSVICGAPFDTANVA